MVVVPVETVIVLAVALAPASVIEVPVPPLKRYSVVLKVIPALAVTAPEIVTVPAVFPKISAPVGACVAEPWAPAAVAQVVEPLDQVPVPPPPTTGAQ